MTDVQFPLDFFQILEVIQRQSLFQPMSAFKNPHERPQSETIGPDLVPYFIEESEAQTRYISHQVS